ncbi:MAG: hypothetical protein GY798_29680 [Hyphomicrobiales bacterium]|nr:hypothetical protein [Hyphomicrobiales bacterium]
MTNWLRIGDHETALFGNRRWEFKFSGGTYLLVATEADQEFISIEYNNKTELWPIALKEKSGDTYKLSGMADWVPEILEDVRWFELFICPAPNITYWGDSVIYRTDFTI